MTRGTCDPRALGTGPGHDDPARGYDLRRRTDRRGGAPVPEAPPRTSTRVTKRAPLVSPPSVPYRSRRDAPDVAGRAWVPGGRARSPVSRGP